MTSRWERALAAVAARCDGRLERILRVDLGQRAAIRLGLGGNRWFQVDDVACQELLAEDDGELPLARELPRLRRTGQLTICSWRPGRRIVLRVDREGGSVILKGYRRRRSAAAARRHAIAAEALARIAAGGAALAAPEILLHDEQLACLQMRCEVGTPLLGDEAARSRFELIGSSLRALQDQLPAQGLEVHGAPEELAALDRVADRASAVDAGPGAAWRQARERLRDELTLARELEPRLVHRDLHDGQFLVTHAGLLLLDFDLLALGDTALDAANLLAHLRLRSLQGLAGAARPVVAEAGRALLDGLDHDQEPDFAGRLRWYQAATFLRLALVHGLRPVDRALAGPLTCMATRCLDDRRRN